MNLPRASDLILGAKWGAGVAVVFNLCLISYYLKTLVEMKSAELEALGVIAWALAEIVEALPPVIQP